MGIEWLGTWNRRALSKPSLYYSISHQKTMIYGDGIFHCIESPSAAVYEFHIFYPRSATVYFIISNTRIPIGIEQQQKKKTMEQLITYKTILIHFFFVSLLFRPFFFSFLLASLYTIVSFARTHTQIFQAHTTHLI